MGFDITFDLETHSAAERWDRRSDFIRLCAYAFNDNDPELVTPETMSRVIELADVSIGHNILSYDIPVLALDLGLDMHSLVRDHRLVDTKLTAFLNDPPSERMKTGQVEKAYSLQSLTGAKAGDLKQLAKQWGGFGSIPINDPEFVAYLKGDVRAARKLYGTLTLSPYVWREHRVAAIAAQISMNGFLVDQALLERRLAEGANTKSEGIRKLTDVYGLPTTKKDGKPVTSPQATEAGKHAIDMAFRALKVTLPRTQAGAPALGQDVMDEVVERYGENPEVLMLADLVKSLNGVRTVYQTVADNLHYGRVHPDIAMRQVSGRWSVSKPGLTVMGKRGGRYHEREIFLPEADEVIISVDLDQVDARAIAAHSQDHAYMDLFSPGRDLHTEVAVAVWNDPSRREDAKVIGHGWNYGMSPRGMVRSFGIPIHVAEQFDLRMTEQFPRLVEWRTEVRERAENSDFLNNGFGRKMRVNRDRAWTQGPALMGQGTARDILMEGLLRLPSELLPMLRAVVHDEVVLSVPRHDAHDIYKTVIDSLSFPWTPPHGSRPIYITAGLAGPPSPSWGGVYEK